MEMSSQSVRTQLIYTENYGFYSGIAVGDHITVHTSDITKENWNAHYDSILNIFKDGIELEEIQRTMITIIFADGMSIDLSLFDYYMNLIMWYVLIFTNTPIESKHIVFVDEFKQDTIKEYMDEFLIEENRKKFSSIYLNNIIDDALQKLHDIDLFALYLSNTLCLEDNIALMKAVPEFNQAMHIDMSGVPIEDVKSTGMMYANAAIDIMKNSKEILGYDHCLADAWRASQGINPKQFKEFTINIGTKPDGRGSVFPAIINSSFINGGVQTPMDYYIESSTGRTAQIIKLKNVGSSGSFARLLALNNMDSRLCTDPNYDCHSQNFIKILVNSKTELNRLNNKYYRFSPHGMEYVINSRKDNQLIGKTIYIRSPITCASNAAGRGICYKCYGDLSYTVFDADADFGINIGRIASEELSSRLTQKLLSAKHLLETVITKLIWVPEFVDFFEVEANTIKLQSDIENLKDFAILIDPATIELENEEDDDLSDDSEDAVNMYNEYITAFDVVCYSAGKEYHITNEKMEKLYITNELNSLIRKKGEPIDGKISIGFNEIKDGYLFVMQIENNELSKTLNKLQSILNKKAVTQSYSDISELFQSLLDTTVEGGIGISSTHLETIMSNQVRSNEEMFEKPHWWESNPHYNIITLNEALTNNPSIVISLSYQKIKKMFYNPLTFKKNGASFMDLFFMEHPQRLINDMPTEVVYRPNPGEIIDPMIFVEDPNKITVTDAEIIVGEEED